MFAAAGTTEEENVQPPEENEEQKEEAYVEPAEPVAATDTAEHIPAADGNEVAKNEDEDELGPVPEIANDQFEEIKGSVVEVPKVVARGSPQKGFEKVAPAAEAPETAAGATETVENLAASSATATYPFDLNKLAKVSNCTIPLFHVF